MTSFSRLFGLAGARDQNRQVAERTCPDGFLLLSRSQSQDENGVFERWEYGCLAQ